MGAMALRAVDKKFRPPACYAWGLMRRNSSTPSRSAQKPATHARRKSFLRMGGDELEGEIAGVGAYDTCYVTPAI